VRPVIDTERQTSCPICGAAGDLVYEGLRDHLYDAPGVWSYRLCPACGLLWLDPRPTRVAIGEAYRTYYTHGSASPGAKLATAVITRVARERAAQIYGFGRPTIGLAQLCTLAGRFYPGLANTADALIRHLSAQDIGGDARILDVGCGDGSGIAFLESLGWRASGVEIDPVAVQAARARGLDVIEGDMESAGFDDESFDAVTSSHVVEHLHDPRAFLDKIRRVLRPGGVLVITTPNVRSELLSRHGRNWRGLEPPRHLMLFTADNLFRLASAAGLRDVEVQRTAHLASFMHIGSAAIASEGRPVGLVRAAKVWLESKVIEARLTRDVLLGQAEGAELALIARK
jgi:SAM-dependent methyltransferase